VPHRIVTLGLLIALGACGRSRNAEPLIGLWREGAQWKYRCTHELKDKTWVERWAVTKAVAGEELVIEGHDVYDTVTGETKDKRIRMVGADTWLKDYPEPEAKETVVAAGHEFSCVVHKVIASRFWFDLAYPRLIVKQEWHDDTGKLIFRRELIEFDDG